MKQCSRCLGAFYCNAECQAAAWAKHKKACSKTARSSPESTAARRRCPELVSPLLASHSIRRTPGDRALLNQVALVVNGGSDKLVRALLKRGADPSSACAEKFDFMRTSKAGLSPLHVAALVDAAIAQPPRSPASCARFCRSPEAPGLDAPGQRSASTHRSAAGDAVWRCSLRRHPRAALAVLRAVGAQALARCRCRPAGAPRPRLRKSWLALECS